MSISFDIFRAYCLIPISALEQVRYKTRNCPQDYFLQNYCHYNENKMAFFPIFVRQLPKNKKEKKARQTALSPPHQRKTPLCSFHFTPGRLSIEGGGVVSPPRLCQTITPGTITHLQTIFFALVLDCVPFCSPFPSILFSLFYFLFSHPLINLAKRIWNTKGCTYICGGGRAFFFFFF